MLFLLVRADIEADVKLLLAKWFLAAFIPSFVNTCFRLSSDGVKEVFRIDLEIRVFLFMKVKWYYT